MRFIFLPFFLALSVGFAQTDSKLFEIELKHPILLNNTVELKQALNQVIYKLKPGSEDLENPVLADASPQAYLSSKTLKRFDQGAQQIIQFNSPKILELMHQAAITPLLKARPQVLVIADCILNLKLEHRFMSQKTDAAFYAALKNAAYAKGLKLIFLNSEQSARCQKRIHEKKYYSQGAELCKDDYNPIHAPIVLHMELNKNGREKPIIGALWYVTLDGQEERLSIKHHRGYCNATYDIIAKVAMDDLSEFLLTLEEKNPSHHHSVYVNIGGIKTVQQYENLNNYLAKIPGVKETHVHSVTADAALYKLDIVIPENLLHARLARKFVVQPNEPNEDITNYRIKI